MKKENLNLRNLRNDGCLAKNVILCQNTWERARGLLGRARLGESEACWILRCRGIHSFGMAYALDVYFLDRENRVVSILKHFPPNRISPIIWRARSVIEFSFAPTRDCSLGDCLKLETCNEQST